MKYLRSLSLLGWLVVLAVMVSGCLLISGTFVIVQTFSFSASSDFYHYAVDLSDQKAWDDHKDKIDAIEAVGMEFFITSAGSAPVNFYVYVDELRGGDPTSVPGTATVVLDSLQVPVGTTHITYAQSLTHLKNLAKLKTLVKSGEFDFYAVKTGTGATSFTVDSGKVIVTFSASN